MSDKRNSNTNHKHINFSQILPNITTDDEKKETMLALFPIDTKMEGNMPKREIKHLNFKNIVQKKKNTLNFSRKIKTKKNKLLPKIRIPPINIIEAHSTTLQNKNMHFLESPTVAGVCLSVDNYDNHLLIRDESISPMISRHTSVMTIPETKLFSLFSRPLSSSNLPPEAPELRVCDTKRVMPPLLYNTIYTHTN